MTDFLRPQTARRSLGADRAGSKPAPTAAPLAALLGLAALAVAGSATAPRAETPAERGATLVQGIMGCGNCHTPMGPEGPVMSQDLSGRLVDKNDMFTAIAPNITPAGRVADWSDAELARAIREGIRPDGSIIGPPMPFAAYRAMSDEDLAAVVAYLRTVPAVEADPGQSTYAIPLPPAYGPPLETPVTAPPAGATVEYGGYLAALGHCMECHSPLTPQGPDWGEGFARGGMEFHGPWGVSHAPNLTNHEDGLAGYSDAELKTMIGTGTRPDGAQMLPPMPYGYFGRLSEQDMEALVLYLRSIPGKPDL
ncbi:c-type cytochrome [Pseudooceanicola nanhaiensis]|uniref:c-type cytochrome n=1 Tax=Pseudooceanicola nanhaiensis TaxID=375761 RepID=UPI001CD2DB1F|nr:c-type cytochrome [Pseudooceanicola nanhaiensis]MCA0920135.1 cytochrome c [Pseudooceanicola nanhaiensis]